jgi:hypothetical protein
VAAAARAVAPKADAAIAVSSPIMMLFREWEATYSAACNGTDEVCTALLRKCGKIEARMLSMPATGAADMAAKFLALSHNGYFLIDADSPFVTEALALVGRARP